MRFDHERIPERVVHARGAAAFGKFTLFKSAAEHTYAEVLNDTSRETPVFLRFSTVAGSRGSADTVRDVRGFAVKFYTEEGNWDIVGNNIPVFFIQESIKFPDISEHLHNCLLMYLANSGQSMLSNRSLTMKSPKPSQHTTTVGTSFTCIPNRPICMLGTFLTARFRDPTE